MAAEGSAVAPSDESLHAPGADPLWSESFYLNFSDTCGRLGGFTRIALHPARKETEGLLCVYLPDGGIGITLASGPLDQPDERSVCAGGLVYERLDPLQHWHVRYDGPVHVFEDPGQVPLALRTGTPTATGQVAIDLDVTGLHAPFFYPGYRRVKSPPPHHANERIGFGRLLKRAVRRPGEILSALRMRSGRHYEQSVVVRGSIAVNGEPFPFDGTGHRDHSWGRRDWAPSERWRWMTGQMDGLAFNAMYLTIAGTHVTNGYVWRGGLPAAVDELRLDNTFDGSGLAGRELRLELTAGGERVLITGEVFLNVPLPIVGKTYSTMYNIGRTRYRCGDRAGYGVAEFLERLQP
jgi:hypothetical protein